MKKAKKRERLNYLMEHGYYPEDAFDFNPSAFPRPQQRGREANYGPDRRS